VNGGGDGVEVAGANLTLVLDGGEAALLSCLELTVLQVDEGGHAFTGVAVCQVEHAVVEGVEASQGDELELEAHGAQFLLELGDLICIQVCGPVEGRGAVVGQQLVRELAADALCELLGQCEVRGAGLHPDHVCVGGVGLCTCDAGLQARLDVVVTLGGALAGDEGNVALINVRGDQGGGLCVG